MLDRRAVIAVIATGVLVVPVATAARQARVYRIGVVYLGGSYSDVVAGLRDGLKDRGLEEASTSPSSCVA